MTEAGQESDLDTPGLDEIGAAFLLERANARWVGKGQGDPV